MTDPERLCAVYHPAVTIRNKTTLATLCLYFDEVHCVPFLPLYESKRGDLRDFQIIIPFVTEGDDVSSFLTETGPLEDEVLFYPRETIGRVIREEIPETEQLWALAESVFKQGHIDMHKVVRSSVIGMLAERRGWIPVGDEQDIPTPLPPAVHFSSRNVSFPDAEECFRLSLPLCGSVLPQDILEARENLKDELLSFRKAMRSLSSMVLTLVDSFSLPDLIQEANAAARNVVEPTLNELRLKIDEAENTAWKRAFGNNLALAPLIGFAFAAPTPKLLGNVISKNFEGVNISLSAEGAVGASMRPGFSLLLKMD
jgi:hypothetical protein